MHSVKSALLSCLVLIVAGEVVKGVLTHYFQEHAQYDERFREIVFQHTRQQEQEKYGVGRTKDVI